MNANTKKILLVEDDEDLCTTLREFLEIEGYRLICAKNGEEALQLLHQLPRGELPACILLDLQMPVMDGGTFLEILSKDGAEELVRIPVIVLTAKTLNDEKVRQRAVETMSKPFDVEHLLTTIAKNADFPAERSKVPERLQMH